MANDNRKSKIFTIGVVLFMILPVAYMLISSYLHKGARPAAEQRADSTTTSH